MFTRATAVTLALMLVATLGFGGVEPQPAEANDTGKILAGLAAGALVYGALDAADKDHRQHYRYDNDRRGYYDGNRRSWKFDQDRRRSHYQFERHQDHRYHAPSRHNSNRRAYNHGYDDGFGDGHRVGYDRGYDRGYDHGYDNGRYGGGGCWGGWGY